MWGFSFSSLTILVLALFINAVATTYLGLSQLVLYNVQRIHTEGLDGFTSSISAHTMQKNKYQQQAKLQFNIEPQGKATIGIENGATAFILRGSNMLFPPSDALFSTSDKLPMLKIEEELQLNAGDSILIMVPLNSMINSKPVDIEGALAHQRPDKEFIESYVKNLPNSVDVAIIGAVVVDKAKIEQIGEKKQAKAKKEHAKVDSPKEENDEEEDELNVRDIQWASLANQPSDEPNFDINDPIVRLLTSALIANSALSGDSSDRSSYTPHSHSSADSSLNWTQRSPLGPNLIIRPLETEHSHMHQERRPARAKKSKSKKDEVKRRISDREEGQNDLSATHTHNKRRPHLSRTIPEPIEEQERETEGLEESESNVSDKDTHNEPQRYHLTAKAPSKKGKKRKVRDFEEIERSSLDMDTHKEPRLRADLSSKKEKKRTPLNRKDSRHGSLDEDKHSKSRYRDSAKKVPKSSRKQKREDS